MELHEKLFVVRIILAMWELRSSLVQQIKTVAAACHTFKWFFSHGLTLYSGDLVPWADSPHYVMVLSHLEDKSQMWMFIDLLWDWSWCATRAEHFYLLEIQLHAVKLLCKSRSNCSKCFGQGIWFKQQCCSQPECKCTHNH